MEVISGDRGGLSRRHFGRQWCGWNCCIVNRTTLGQFLLGVAQYALTSLIEFRYSEVSWRIIMAVSNEKHCIQTRRVARIRVRGISFKG